MYLLVIANLIASSSSSKTTEFPGGASRRGLQKREGCEYWSVLALERTTLHVQPSGSCPWPCAGSTEPPCCDPSSIVLLLCPLMKHETVCSPEINVLCNPKTMRTHVTLLEPCAMPVLLFYYGTMFLQIQLLSQLLLDLPYLPFKR